LAICRERLNKSAVSPSYKSGSYWADHANAALPMCEKCVEIDKNIERYRKIQRSIGDQVTVDRTKELIAELEDQKAALHPAE
jgi:hypothetical protein